MGTVGSDVLIMDMDPIEFFNFNVLMGLGLVEFGQVGLMEGIG